MDQTGCPEHRGDSKSTYMLIETARSMIWIYTAMAVRDSDSAANICFGRSADGDPMAMGLAIYQIVTRTTDVIDGLR
jgi:hypothetical protein